MARGRRRPNVAAWERYAVLYDDGMTIRQIAKYYGRSPSTVLYGLKALDVPRRPPGAWKKLNPELIQAMCWEKRFYDYTTIELGDRYGVSQSYAARLIRRHLRSEAGR